MRYLGISQGNSSSPSCTFCRVGWFNFKVGTAFSQESVPLPRSLNCFESQP
ncbi:hypothetical protein CDL12_11759 [Handroanthus impetiginosus]|uniref:Uncharacterized protein n=1 Tax=Handroanthus impetiginosus TaxID=429701 RepID=A0A2G9HDJ3_9LAMI|nr:hypothetical protein CDL12_11759 [Handroanthus impetiginosus]